MNAKIADFLIPISIYHISTKSLFTPPLNLSTEHTKRKYRNEIL